MGMLPTSFILTSFILTQAGKRDTC